MSKEPTIINNDVFLRPFEKAKIKAANKMITLIALQPSIIRAEYFSLKKIFIDGSKS